jgi:tRNA threonylcarbamoyladenosine dehydratase
MPPQFFTTDVDVPATAKQVDAALSGYRELFFLNHPELSKNDPANTASALTFARERETNSIWVFYPWLGSAIRLPDEESFFRIRTGRNEVLITSGEQQAFRRARIAIAGLSVGSAALATLVATGGPKRLRIADNDTIEISNLNRMRADITDLGVNKAVAAARHTWELDPFAEIEVWEQGATPTVDFIRDMQVVVDEMDSIDAKVSFRNECRASRIPVVMATDNGDGAILDIERFDLEPERPIFHGRVDLEGKKLSELSRQEFAALASEIIDPGLFTPRQKESVDLLGTKLAGIAQIATAAGIAGAAVAYAVRLIVTKQELPSGRYLISPEKLIKAATNA